MNTLISVVALILFSTSLYSQRYSVNIQSYGRDKYQVYIDEELQSYHQALNYRIQGIPNGVKVMKVIMNTNPKQEYSLTIGSTGTANEYYTLAPQGKNYQLANQKESFRFSSSNLPSTVNFVAKRAPVKLESGFKQAHTCEMTDSAVNLLIENIADLKDEKSKESFQDMFLKAKCLLTYQIRALAGRFNDDTSRIRLYKKLYLGCNDKSKYPELSKSFESLSTAQEFSTWLSQQK